MAATTYRSFGTVFNFRQLTPGHWTCAFGPVTLELVRRRERAGAPAVWWYRGPGAEEGEAVGELSAAAETAARRLVTHLRRLELLAEAVGR
jgi:hypothetical protein